MSTKKEKGFWINWIESDGKESKEWVGENSTSAQVGKFISDLIDIWRGKR